MSHCYQLIVFDWDGTLMDSTGLIASSIQAAARDIGVEPPSDERARHIIGLGLGDALRYALPDLPDGRYAELAERYRYNYLAQDQQLKMFADVDLLMERLSARGHYLAVATGKSQAGLQRAMAVSGLHEYFQATRCADQCRSKPHPEMLLELMDEFAVSPEFTLMIGDTTHDLLMARNAGVDSVAMTHGAHPATVLAAESPLFCANDLKELSDWLAKNA